MSQGGGCPLTDIEQAEAVVNGLEVLDRARYLFDQGHVNVAAGDKVNIAVNGVFHSVIAPRNGTVYGIDIDRDLRGLETVGGLCYL